MVRLKVKTLQDDINRIIVFQFLMVRLKDRVYITRYIQPFISIPYGAIKRFLSFKKLRLIKRFQFLMVRLKVTFKLTDSYLNYISIPYGATILRLERLGDWERKSRF